MPTGNDYELAARELASEIGEGFKTLDTDALRGALREASGTNASLTSPARERLEKALRRERIHVHPPLTDMGRGTYRLYHRDNDVAFLVDAITDPSESADERLNDFLTREVVTVIRQVRSAP